MFDRFLLPPYQYKYFYCNFNSILILPSASTLVVSLSLTIYTLLKIANNAQKMMFSIKDFFCKCDQTRSLLRIWSHLLKKSLMENFFFCAVKHGLIAGAFL